MNGKPRFHPRANALGRGGSRALLRATAATAFLALLALLDSDASIAASPPQTRLVGVVQFYAPTPLGYFSGMIPERFAAEDLSNQLARAVDARFTVIPRATIAQAEAGMAWQEPDVLSFGRLKLLARAVNADWLVVGWIPLLNVGGGGHRRAFPDGGGGGMHDGDAAVVVQVFDVAQGRIIAETRRFAYSLGSVRRLIAEEALHQALQPTVPLVIGALSGRTPPP